MKFPSSSSLLLCILLVTPSMGTDFLHYHCSQDNTTRGECMQSTGLTNERLKLMCGLTSGQSTIAAGTCSDRGYNCEEKLFGSNSDWLPKLLLLGISGWLKPASDGVCRMEFIWSNSKQKEETCCTAESLSISRDSCACRCDSVSLAACRSATPPRRIEVDDVACMDCYAKNKGNETICDAVCFDATEVLATGSLVHWSDIDFQNSISHSCLADIDCADLSTGKDRCEEGWCVINVGPMAGDRRCGQCPKGQIGTGGWCVGPETSEWTNSVCASGTHCKSFGNTGAAFCNGKYFAHLALRGLAAKK